jgi:hypothetical protein
MDDRKVRFLGNIFRDLSIKLTTFSPHREDRKDSFLENVFRIRGWCPTSPHWRKLGVQFAYANVDW